MERVSATISGGEDFTLNEGAVTTWLWVAVRQTNGEATRDLITTLQPVNSMAATSAELVIADRLSLSDLATIGTLVMPTELDPTRGHALIHFVNGAGTPVSDVSLANTPNIASAVLAYDAGPAFSDGLDSTQVAGAVLILNMGAEIFPGGTKRLLYRQGAMEQPLDIEVARDALTLVTVTLN